jgi:hypothetical protein
VRRAIAFSIAMMMVLVLVLLVRGAILRSLCILVLPLLGI